MSVTLRRLPLWAFAALGTLTPLCLGFVWGVASPSHRWLGFTPIDNSSYQTRLLVALVVQALLPLGALWFRGGRRRTALLSLWIGVLVAEFLTAAATPGVHFGGVLGQIGIYVILFLTGMPLLVGALCQAILEEAIQFVRKGRARPPAFPSSEGAA